MEITEPQYRQIEHCLPKQRGDVSHTRDPHRQASVTRRRTTELTSAHCGDRWRQYDLISLSNLTISSRRKSTCRDRTRYGDFSHDARSVVRDLPAITITMKRSWATSMPVLNEKSAVVSRPWAARLVQAHRQLFGLRRGCSLEATRRHLLASPRGHYCLRNQRN